MISDTGIPPYKECDRMTRRWLQRDLLFVSLKHRRSLAKKKDEARIPHSSVKGEAPLPHIMERGIGT